MLHGHPISSALPEDLGLGERFWYWRGQSGRSYIHSIYACGTCPPLQGAVFVAVRRTEQGRVPVCVGRFPVAADGGVVPDCDELHVHLLARNDETAQSVMMDLLAALGGTENHCVELQGFHEPRQLELVLAA